MYLEKSDPKRVALFFEHKCPHRCFINFKIKQ